MQQRHHGCVVRPLRIERKRPQYGLAQLHLHKRICQWLQPHATPLNREERTPQTLRARLLAELGKNVVKGLYREIFLSRDTNVLYELADLRAN